MAVSAEGQFEISAGGALLMGPGTVYRITAVSGLDAPDVETHDLPILAGGVYPARDRLNGRTISLDLNIRDASTLATSLSNFTAAWATGTNTDVTLTYRWYGQAANRYATGRARRCKWTFKYDEFGLGYVSAAVDFFCPNPVIKLSSGDTPVTF